MLPILQIISIMVVFVPAALSLAHALELPGKLRLTREQYFSVQAIYYPGFTVGGIAEPVGVVLVIVLMLIMPVGALSFWLVVGALGALVAMHGTYWLVTHPVNGFWLEDFRMKKWGTGFFSLRSSARATGQPDWTVLRRRWEASHAVRAVLGTAAMTLLVVSITERLP